MFTFGGFTLVNRVSLFMALYIALYSSLYISIYIKAVVIRSRSDEDIFSYTFGDRD